eukprot:3212725-Amphidinium_carterae.1
MHSVAGAHHPQIFDMLKLLSQHSAVGNPFRNCLRIALGMNMGGTVQFSHVIRGCLRGPIALVVLLLVDCHSLFPFAVQVDAVRPAISRYTG